MDDEITASALQKLIGVRKSVLNELAAKGVVKRGEKRGTFVLEASVSGYCKHLRDMASARGGEDASAARARLGQAQADLAEAKAAQIRGETVPVAEVETFWRSKLKAFRNRVLAVPGRVKEPHGAAERDLDARATGGADRACRWWLSCMTVPQLEQT
jgi:phage terminase Nu1 subunit (DNA packaging protein)